MKRFLFLLILLLVFCFRSTAQKSNNSKIRPLNEFSDKAFNLHPCPLASKKEYDPCYFLSEVLIPLTQANLRLREKKVLEKNQKISSDSLVLLQIYGEKKVKYIDYFKYPENAFYSLTFKDTVISISNQIENVNRSEIYYIQSLSPFEKQDFKIKASLTRKCLKLSQKNVRLKYSILGSSAINSSHIYVPGLLSQIAIYDDSGLLITPSEEIEKTNSFNYVQKLKQNKAVYEIILETELFTRYPLERGKSYTMKSIYYEGQQMVDDNSIFDFVRIPMKSLQFQVCD